MKTFYTSEREIWREWLAEHFEIESEVWFVFPMKESGDKALSYNDAVEEALCFGWIDSTIKHIDPTHRAQRFTPRKKGSPYSRPNIERLIWLDERGMLHPSVREAVLPIISTPYVFPIDILDVISGHILPQFVKVHTTPFENGFVRAIQHPVGGSSGMYRLKTLYVCLYFGNICHSHGVTTAPKIASIIVSSCTPSATAAKFSITL